LPPPFGLWDLGKWYLPLTAFCFAAMSNGVNLTDGLDGLAAGTCAAAYIGMAVAVLPIYPGEYSALDYYQNIGVYYTDYGKYCGPQYSAYFHI
jgi:UDP-N-acetylmuramyl pentapeptide phosphotransferase/UDP-N-acetylglucosamine-1-phosphate transferase